MIRQSPSAGSEVEPGAAVAIVVSRAKEKAKVPNVIGRLRAEAVEAMRDAGLEPTVEEEETEVPSQVGRVIDQFPTPGTEAGTGPEVTDRRRQAGAAPKPKPEAEE